MSKYIKSVSNRVGAIIRVRRKMHKHVHDRGRELQEWVKKMHLNAPRGGQTTNYYGEQRSAPGEPPAIEHGGLRDAILNEATFKGNPTRRANEQEAAIMVNYDVLEYGKRDRTLKPRPMGRKALVYFKQDVRRR